MRVGNLEIKAPLILGGEESEAEVLGATVWLWMHSPMHRDAPLHALPTLLLPIIKRRQYVLVIENDRPVFFLNWAWLNEEAEARYLTRPSIEMPEADWDSGNRIWFCDWIAPFGHTRDVRPDAPRYLPRPRLPRAVSPRRRAWQARDAVPRQPRQPSTRQRVATESPARSKPAGSV